MIHTSYRITCDRCNRREYSEGDEEQGEMLLSAHEQGWRSKLVENGSTWDFCPRCVEIEKIESLANCLR